MTRGQFVARAIRAAERDLRVPPGWRGTWRDVTNGKVRVHLTARRYWRITRAGVELSRHDSRDAEIRKAAKL